MCYSISSEEGYATLSDDVNELAAVAADGLLRTALLGLEIFGEPLDDVSLLSDELPGNFLLESYTTHIIIQYYNNTYNHSL